MLASKKTNKLVCKSGRSPTTLSSLQQATPQNKLAYSRGKKKNPKGEKINFLAVHTRATYPAVQSAEGSQLSNSLLHPPSVGAADSDLGNSGGQILRTNGYLHISQSGPAGSQGSQAARIWLESTKCVTQTKLVLLAPQQANNREVSCQGKENNFIQKTNRPRRWWAYAPKNHLIFIILIAQISSNHLKL